MSAKKLRKMGIIEPILLKGALGSTEGCFLQLWLRESGPQTELNKGLSVKLVFLWPVPGVQERIFGIKSKILTESPPYPVLFTPLSHWKSEVRGPAWWRSGEDLLQGHRWLSSHCFLMWQREEASSLMTLRRAWIPFLRIFTLMISSNPKGPTF